MYVFTSGLIPKRKREFAKVSTSHWRFVMIEGECQSGVAPSTIDTIIESIVYLNQFGDVEQINSLLQLLWRRLRVREYSELMFRVSS